MNRGLTARIVRPLHLSVLATELRLQLRNGFYAVYAVMTFVFFLVLAAVPAGLREGGFELLVLMDPAMMGFFFAGGLVLLERDQGILQLIVTRGHGFTTYWRAKIVAILGLAIVVVVALTLVSSLLGFISPSLRGLLHIGGGLILAVPLFFSLGLTFAGWKPKVIEYFLYSTLALTPFMYPLIELGGISVGYLGVFSPIWGAMVLIRSAFSTVPSAEILAAAILSLVGWNVVAYYAARRAFASLAGTASAPTQRAHPTPGSANTRHLLLRRLPKLPADIRLMLRDRVNFLILVAPFLAAAVIGRGIPAFLASEIGTTSIPEVIRVGIAESMNNLRSFTLLLGVLMYGMLGALLYLDEKDENVLPFLQTLPGRPGWFILRRAALLYILYLVALPGLIIAGDLLHPGVGALRFGISLALDVAGIPLMFLGMGLFAANKVQGLAMAKLMNTASLPPLILIALPERFAWIVGAFPTGWGSIIRLNSLGTAQLMVAALIGGLYSGTLLFFLYRKATTL